MLGDVTGDRDLAALRLSVVSTIGYAAFLGGSPLLGFLGDHFGVLHALTNVGAISVLAAVVAPAARPTARSPHYHRPPAADGVATRRGASEHAS